MKKILAICLTLIMVFSMFTVAVSAATLEVPAKTFFNQSFAGLTADTIPSGWTISGGTEGTTYSFGANGIRAKNWQGFQLYKNDAFDTNGRDYTFSVKFAHGNGVSYLHIGAPTAGAAYSGATGTGGYTMKIDNPNTAGYGVYTVYKDGVEIGKLEDATKSAYQSNRTFTFKVTSEGITVTGAGKEFTHADTKPITKGYVGITLVDNSSYFGNLASMSLVADAYSYTVNDTQANTGATITTPSASSFTQSFAGTLAADPSGWTTANGSYVASGIRQAYTPLKNNIPLQVGKNTAFNTNGMDYTFTINFSCYSKTQYIHFGAATYAEAIAASVGNTGYTLEVVSNTSGTHTYNLYKNGSKLTTWSHNNGVALKEYVFEVTSTGITVRKGSAEPITVADTAPITSGFIGVNLRNNTPHDWNITTLASVSVESNVVKTNFLLDKTFSASDSEAALEANGYTITDGTTFTASGAAHSSNSYSIAYTDVAFGGDYTVETKMYKEGNGTQYIRLNKNGSSYYQLAFGQNDCTITKLIDGTTVKTWDAFTGSAAYLFTYCTTAFTVNVSEEDDGSIKIEFKAVGAGGTLTGDVTDTPADDNVVLTSGNVQIAENVYSDAKRIKSLKIYPTSQADNLGYTGNFVVNGTADADKGDVVMMFPVVMLGQTPDVVAALYEDNMMTDIKLLNIADINEAGYVRLFDTTQSKATDINVKVFMWNSLSGMVPVTSTFSLNN